MPGRPAAHLPSCCRAGRASGPCRLPARGWPCSGVTAAGMGSQRTGRRGPCGTGGRRGNPGTGPSGAGLAACKSSGPTSKALQAVSMPHHPCAPAELWQSPAGSRSDTQSVNSNPSIHPWHVQAGTCGAVPQPTSLCHVQLPVCAQHGAGILHVQRRHCQAGCGHMLLLPSFAALFSAQVDDRNQITSYAILLPASARLAYAGHGS